MKLPVESLDINGHVSGDKSRVPYYVKGLALGLPAYFVAIHFWAWLLIVPLFFHRADFRQFYTGAYMVRTGHGRELYDFSHQKAFEDRIVSPEPEIFELPFVSPAYHALFLAPFTLIPYGTAYLTFAIFNLVMLAIAFILLHPWMSNLLDIYKFLPFAIFAGFYPIARAFVMGQDSVMLTTILAGSFVLLTKRRDLLAGALASLGLFKFQIVLPIALLFCLWKRWRFILGFGCSASLLFAVSVFLTGTEQTKIYFESLLSVSGMTGQITPIATHQLLWQMMPNVHGFVFGTLVGLTSRKWIEVLTLLLSGTVLGWTLIKGFHIRDGARLLLLAIPCGVLVGHHTYMYDLSVLLIPMVVLLNSFLPSEGDGNKSERLGRAAALMFVAPVVDPFFPNHSYLVCLAVLGLLLATASPALASKFCDRTR